MKKCFILFLLMFPAFLFAQKAMTKSFKDNWGLYTYKLTVPYIISNGDTIPHGLAKVNANNGPMPTNRMRLEMGGEVVNITVGVNVVRGKAVTATVQGTWQVYGSEYKRVPGKGIIAQITKKRPVRVDWSFNKPFELLDILKSHYPIDMKELEEHAHEIRKECQLFGENCQTTVKVTSSTGTSGKGSNIKEAYLKKVNEYVNMRKSDDYLNDFYFLHDITGDDIPELWIEAADRSGKYLHVLYVYTMKEGQATLLFQENAGHPSHHTYHKGKGYVLIDHASMGAVARYKLEFLNGRVNKVTLFNGREEDIKDYQEPVEPMIETIELEDKSPLQKL